MYASCLIIWAGKIEYLITLIITEDEYIPLSTVLPKVIRIFNLLEDLNGSAFNVQTNTPKVTCRKCEDNRIGIEIATNHHTGPRTKHLSARLHHFCLHVVQKPLQ